MFKKFFQVLGFKKMARHLRKPSGAFGIDLGLRMNKSNKALYDFTLDLIQPAYYESILEIGFGNGKFFGELSSQAEGLNLAGIDYSETMVTAAAELNAGLISEGKLTLHQGSSDSLPFADQSFDKIFCINVIYFWDKPGEHLGEIYRILKPGGKFFATIRSRESMASMPFTRYGFNSYSEEEWKNLVTRHQFNFISTSTLDEPQIEFSGRTLQFQSLCMVAQK